VLPPDSAAQRRPPSGAVVHRGTAVTRTYHSGGPYHPGGAYYHPYYYRPYYRPYYYSRYYYPYYPYYYAPFYYPSYYGFGVGFGFGWGSVGASFGYGYGYPNPYPYGYAAPYTAAAPYGYAPPYAGNGPAGYGPSNNVQMQQPAPAPQNATTAESGSFGTLSMRVTPAEATILIDGQVWDRPQGQDRFAIDLVEGTHRVEVRQQGYTPYTRVVQIRGGGTLTLNVSLPSGGGGSQVQQLAVRRTVPLR
jgi:PEGA domain